MQRAHILDAERQDVGIVRVPSPPPDLIFFAGRHYVRAVEVDLPEPRYLPAMAYIVPPDSVRLSAGGEAAD